MDVAETTVAIMVEIPASTKTGNGRDEPEPEPNFGRVKNMLTKGPSLRTREQFRGEELVSPFKVVQHKLCLRSCER